MAETRGQASNPSAQESAKEGRAAAQLLRVQFIERHVASVERLQAALRALRARDADAYVAVSDAMVDNQAQLLIDTAKAKKLPTMSYQEGFVRKGGLASYGSDWHEAGRLAAKHVQRILAGTNPKDLPVEGTDRFTFAVNLKTAKQIGLKIPQTVLFRADKVIE
jgi:putative ABC transport system substrate-binding protein